jgi:hypothetical protein
MTKSPCCGIINSRQQTMLAHPPLEQHLAHPRKVSSSLTVLPLPRLADISIILCNKYKRD